jgi:hypothetical protein
MNRLSTCLVSSALVLVPAMALAQSARSAPHAGAAAPATSATSTTTSSDASPPPLPAPASSSPASPAPSPSADADSGALAPLPSPGTPADAPLAPVPAAPPAASAPASSPPLLTFDGAAKRSDPAADREADTGERKAVPHGGFALALGLGYSAPAGSSTGEKDADLAKTVGGQFPISVEIGGNVTPAVFIGAYGSVAPGGVSASLDTTCTQARLDCSSHSLRGGFAFRYRFLPGGPIQPWLGYAVGYESTTVSASSTVYAGTASTEITGWELGHFSFGLDFPVERYLALGPFFDVAVGQYDHVHSQSPTQALDADITNTALHQWITVGVRSVFMP